MTPDLSEPQVAMATPGSDNSVILTEIVEGYLAESRLEEDR